MKKCVCKRPIRREERSNGGEVLATYCSACTRPLVVNCPHCKRETDDLEGHFKLLTDRWEKVAPADYRAWQRKLAEKRS